MRVPASSASASAMYVSTITRAYCVTRVRCMAHVRTGSILCNARVLVVSSCPPARGELAQDWDPVCKAMDEQINRVAPCVTDVAAFFKVDNVEVPDFSKLYELHDPMTLMLFYRKKHVMADVGYGLTNKISWFAPSSAHAGTACATEVSERKFPTQAARSAGASKTRRSCGCCCTVCTRVPSKVERPFAFAPGCSCDSCCQPPAWPERAD